MTLVTTEAVAVEGVRLGTETVSEQQSVSGEVRRDRRWLERLHLRRSRHPVHRPVQKGATSSNAR